MALYQANVSFDHAGVQVKAGQIIDDHYLYVMFPSRFTAVTTTAAAASFTPTAEVLDEDVQAAIAGLGVRIAALE